MSHLLKELSKLDTYWRKVALSICGCSVLADDLVQEMYFKMLDRNPKIWNKRYVWRTIYNLYMDELRRTKKMTDLEYVEITTDPSDSDCIERVIQNAMQEMDDETTKAVMINMDDTVRGTARKMGYSAYKLWSKVKAAKEELRERTDLQTAYKQLKNGDI